MQHTILKRTLIFQGRVFDMEHVMVQLPDGVERRYDLVKHPGAVVLLPVDDEGNLLFVRQFRLGSLSELLELPAGTLEHGEPPEDCARREIREETGMSAGELRLLGDFYMAPGYSTECLFIFLARQLSHDPLEGDADEFLSLEKMPVAEAYRLARQGKINDGKTLAALMMAEEELKA
jgi:ADP-ribose pyrophosphatase